MIMHLWSVLCTRAIVDQSTNGISLIDVLEQLSIPLPAPPEDKATFIGITFTVASLWRRSDLAQPVVALERLSFLDPKGKKLMEAEGRIDMQTHPRTRMLRTYDGITLTCGGTYFFRVEFRCSDTEEWQRACDIPLEIDFAAQ